MRRVAWAFAAAACLLLCSQPSGIAQDDPGKDKARSSLSDIGDITIISDSEQHTKDAQALLKEMAAPHPDPRDRAEEFNKIRPIRARLSKRSLELRALLESFRQYRNSLRSQLEQKKLQGGKVQPFDEFDIERFKQSTEQLKLSIEQQRARLASPSSQDIKAIRDEIDRMEKDLQARESAAATWEIQQKSQKEAAAATANEIKQGEATLSQIDKILNDGQSVQRQLDETLVSLDEASNSLLQTDILNINYTDRSTYIFAILVGMVIVGFFAIAFYSEDARRAIFAGESGIQFVTLFSLVIAIILFGVLKILEGKELAALLGGLSGYILGRGTQGGARQTPAPPPAPPAPPQPV